MSCAAALATLEVIDREQLLENATRLGRFALERLTALQRRFSSVVGDVRGLGLMIGVEFAAPDRKPLPEALQAVVAECLEQRLVLLECGADKNVLRLAPPLVIREEEMSRALDILEHAVARVSA